MNTGGVPTPPAAHAGIFAAVLQLAEALWSRFRNTVELAAAEARLAAMAGVSMLLLIILAAAFTVVGWGFLMVTLAVLAVQAGLSWPVVTVAIAVLHLGGAAAFWFMAMRLSRHLTLPSLRESLALGDGEKAPRK
jgi:hypothetical protein